MIGPPATVDNNKGNNSNHMTPIIGYWTPIPYFQSAVSPQPYGHESRTLTLSIDTVGKLSSVFQHVTLLSVSELLAASNE